MKLRVSFSLTHTVTTQKVLEKTRDKVVSKKKLTE